VGTSLLNPAKPFMELWYQVGKEFPDFKLHLIPYEDDKGGILSVIHNLGVKYDFLIGACESRKWLKECNMLQLGAYKMMCAVSREHRLASKEELTLSDLCKETLMMVAKGDSYENDRLRTELINNYPDIKIEDTAHFYDMNVFNRCVASQNVLITLECWKDVHPALVTIPVKWDYQIPYGLLYALEPHEYVIKYIDCVKKIL
ncbi:MAG: LysR family transcriptional regulator, partial [Lachnospiraceae bacterium]|nr:LysR family transcriptional regulator [Lachnospiraceae bacterium]